MIKTIHKLFILAIATVILCTGCAGEIDTVIPLGHAIDFSCAEVSSRAAETDATTMRTFRVSAVWAKAVGEYVDPFMDRQWVEKDEYGDWLYSPISYMPPYGTVDFFAYSPANAAVSDFEITDHDQVSLHYEVTTDLAMQHDFLVAEALEQSSPAVALRFRHVLSAVSGVEVRSASEGYSFRIHEVKLVGLYRKGLLHGVTTVGDNDAKVTTWSWTPDTNFRTTYTIIQDGAVVVGEAYSPVFDVSAGPMMILPQDNPDACLVVTYDVLDSMNENALVSANKTTTFPLTMTFVPGEKYLLRFDLSS